MQNPFKEFLYFSRGERRGILVLITGIILVFLSGYIYIYQRENRPLSDEVIRRQATAMAEYESFIASIQEKEQKWDNRLKPSSQKQPTTVSLARFNPNIADSVIFCRLGLPGWMARNILRYRSKGGKFHKAEDFRKIYGMTEKQYQTPGVTYGAIYIATAISAVIGTVAIGLLANLPLAQASGMGLNAYFVYTVVLGLGFSYANALVLVLFDGILFILLTVTGLRKLIFQAIPQAVRVAIPAGIGLFIAFLGLQNAGIIIPSASTGVTLASFNLLANGWNVGIMAEKT